MGTEILLMVDVPDLGKEGEVVTVAEGYARNYLLPRKLGAPVTNASRARLARLQKQREAQRAAELEAAQKLAARLEGVSCTIPVKTEQEGKLYGSVGATDIVAALKAQGVEIDRHTIDLENPVKELGVFSVKVKLHPDVTATVKVWVVEE